MSITFLERLKSLIWKLYEPLFPTTRDTLVFLGYTYYNHRQPFNLGWLKPGATARQVRSVLLKAGFSDDYLAWIDPNETLSMRKLVDRIYQYHIRVFIDGEIRGHHEFSTESHPLKHLFEKGMTTGEEYLKPLLQSLLVSERP